MLKFYFSASISSLHSYGEKNVPDKLWTQTFHNHTNTIITMNIGIYKRFIPQKQQ